MCTHSNRSFGNQTPDVTTSKHTVATVEIAVTSSSSGGGGGDGDGGGVGRLPNEDDVSSMFFCELNGCVRQRQRD
jgi:hypothetical protein